MGSASVTSSHKLRKASGTTTKTNKLAKRNHLVFVRSIELALGNRLRKTTTKTTEKSRLIPMDKTAKMKAATEAKQANWTPIILKVKVKLLKTKVELS